MAFVEGGRLAPDARRVHEYGIDADTGAVVKLSEPDPEYVASFCIDRQMAKLKDYERCVAQGVCSALKCVDDPSSIYIECGHDEAVEGFVARAWIWQARSFCKRKGKRLAEYRQWDYAAGGFDSRLYPWGGEIGHVGKGQECRSFGGVVMGPCNWSSAPRDITPFGVEGFNSWAEITDGQGRFIFLRKRRGWGVGSAGREAEYVRGGFRCVWSDFPPGHPGREKPSERQLFQSPKDSGRPGSGDGKAADSAEARQAAEGAEMADAATPKQPAQGAEMAQGAQTASSATPKQAPETAEGGEGEPGGQEVRAEGERCPSDMAFLVGGALERRDGTKVTVAPFCMDKYEVSREQYMRCMSEGRCTPVPCVGRPDAPGDLPVECAHWSQARDYCAAMDKRLPDSAEWYFAAGGFDGRRFPWGDDRPAKEDEVCYRRKHLGPCPIGQSAKDRTPQGIYDLAAGAQEWSADDAPIQGRKYIHGGASYVYYDWLLGNQFALGVEPDATYAGFRCVRSAHVKNAARAPSKG